jgi:hypothetical protein
MRWALTPIALLTIVLGVASCGGEHLGPEAEIRAWVDAMQQDAEDEKRRSIIDRIAEGYADGRGNSRDDIDRMLKLWFLRRDGITLLVNIEDIEVIADTAANVRLTVGMAGTGAGVFGISADAYRFELELGAGGGDWELLSARWGELGVPLE